MHKECMLKRISCGLEQARAALIVHPPAIYTVRSGSNDSVAHTHSVDLLQSSVPGALVMLQLVMTLIVCVYSLSDCF